MVTPAMKAETTLAELPFGSSAIVRSNVALKDSVAEESRTRSFATPTFAGCALIGAESWMPR